MFFGDCTPPAFEKVMVYPEEVENLSYRVLDEVVDRFRMKIEARHGREQDGPCPARLKHQLEMTLVKWGFTNDQNESPPFF